MKKDNKNIGCSVNDCKYNNCDCKCCTLEEIKICSCSDDFNKESTMCDSYKEQNEKEDE